MKNSFEELPKVDGKLSRERGLGAHMVEVLRDLLKGERNEDKDPMVAEFNNPAQIGRAFAELSSLEDVKWLYGEIYALYEGDSRFEGMPLTEGSFHRMFRDAAKKRMEELGGNPEDLRIQG
ncbi:MAG: hypothetical protein AAB483_00375 [Patescibacteria group bacterium]